LIRTVLLKRIWNGKTILKYKEHQENLNKFAEMKLKHILFFCIGLVLFIYIWLQFFDMYLYEFLDGFKILMVFISILFLYILYEIIEHKFLIKIVKRLFKKINSLLKKGK